MPAVRLDELLVSVKDLFPMVAENLDAVSLFRLGAACKDMRKCRKQSEVLRACVLRTFPGIRNFPEEARSARYEKALHIYFLFQNYGPLRSYFEIVISIGKCLEKDWEPYDEEGHDMEEKISQFFDNVDFNVWTYKGRRDIIKCVGDWKSQIVSGIPLFTYRNDVLEMLDRIAYIAEHNFQWHDSDGFVTLEWYYS
jgi:hypothetical protein